jgi:alpha-tubulin suppressor-like RCC1 family protein
MKATLRSVLVCFFSVLLAPAWAQSITGCYYHSLFLCTDGTVKACGANYGGQMGNGMQSPNVSSPITVAGVSGIVAVAGGSGFSLFLKSNGTVWACGANDYGQLGDGTTNIHLAAFQIPGLTNVIRMVGGKGHSMFLKSDGTVWGCGLNIDGQLGDGTSTNRLVPTQITTLSNIIDIGGGQDHCLFLKNNGTVYACGWNFQGELGDGTTTDRHTPVQVLAVSNVIAVSKASAVSQWSAFIKSDGTVWACGKNDYGQFGDGTTAPRYTPSQITGLSGMKAVAGGYAYILCRKNDNTLWACGSNLYGELGDGTTVDKHAFFQVSGISGVVAVAAGTEHSLILLSNGTVKAFGHNGNGALGQGTTDLNPHSTAVLVPGLCTIFIGIDEHPSPDGWSLIFQNPVSASQLECTLYVPEREKLVFDVYNIEGVLMRRETIVAAAGANHIAADLREFAAGIYFIRLYNDEGGMQQKFVKL